MNNNTLFLLDAMALIYRAHFALSRNPNPIMNSKGINTGAIMGFTNSLLEIITKEQPSHIGVAFDTDAPTFRHEEFTEYKANRQKQPEEIQVAIPYCKKVVEAFGIPVLEVDGYEADDLIGTLAKKGEKQGFTVYMMTPDKDFAQLVSENIFLYKPAYMGNAHDVLGIPEVLKKFDLERVEQVIDFLGLKGDAVDNIPGVPGVGDKTASKLLKEFGDVETIVASTDQLKGSLQKKIIEFGEQGIFSKKLATINIEAPINFDSEAFKFNDPDEKVLVPLLDELEFRTISKRLFGESAAQKSAGQMGLFGDEELEKSEVAQPARKSMETERANYVLMDTPEQWEDLASKLRNVDEFCFDTETTSLETVEAELVGIAFSLKHGEAFYAAFPEESKDQEVFITTFKSLLEDPDSRKVGQNLKYDIQILRNYGISVRGQIFDTMLAHYLIEPELAHGMDVLAENYLNYVPVSIESLIGPKGKKQKSMADVPQEQISKYAGEDADITLQLKSVLEKEIEDRQLSKLLHEVEEPLSFVLADMEYEGVSIDTGALEAMSKELEGESLQVRDEIYNLAGEEFNIGSPKQLGDILFDKLKLLEKPKKTKSGQYATGEDVLSKLAHEHEIAGKILLFRELQKLKSTYVDALPKMVSPKDGRVHTDYRQTVAATGRLSSNNPNLQNIPIRTPRGREIRKAFIPRNDDYVILSADYSQVELRIMASFSEDQSMMQAFTDGKDIHSNTASKVFKVALDQVDPDMRRKAKEVNFGIIYGMSAYGLSQNLNISRSEANEIIESYFKEFPAIKEYMDKTIAKAKETEYVESILGRRRYLRNINSRNYTMRGFDERNAINAPIQGSAADIIKVAMINIHDWMKKESLKSKMIMQVHDELVFEAHRKEINLLSSKTEEMMKYAIELKVPLEIGIGHGQNWLEAH